ncbi:MAG TPA: PAS domain S-box protein [Geobacteraceae bacterium]|nr:PAS domain S-box protein [Geobacteraceae bacterium]
MFEKKSDLREQLARSVQELKACKASYHNIMDKSVHGIIIVDDNGVIRFANLTAAEIFGCKAEELLGEQCGLPIISDKAVELNIKSRDGKTVVVESWAVEIEWEGKPARFIAFHNVTERKQNEQELRRLYRATMESPCMVVISDARGSIEYVNPKFTELTGYLPAEVIGRDHGIILPGNLSLEDADRIRESMAKGEEWRGEFINRKKSGEEYWESASIAPVKDFEGTITDFITLKEDITARKNMEASLRDSEEQFRATFEQAAVGIAYLAPDGRLLRINQRYCEIVGYSEAELKKLTFQQITHPDDLDASIKQFTSLRAGKLRNFSLEKRYIRKDGSTVWVNLTVSMVRDPDGNPRYNVSVIEDITARKAAEKAVQESRTRAQALIAAALDAVVEMDEGGTILAWNPMAEEIFGWKAAEAIGRRPSETIIPPQHREAHEKGLSHFLATGEGPILSRRVELSAVHRDGREFPIELTVTPIRTESGYTFTAFVRDISERKSAEEKFKGLLESAPDAMIIVNGNGEICIVNSQTEKLFGYEREELYGHEVEMLMPERFRARHVKHRADYSKDPHMRRLGTIPELFGLHKDGREFPVDISLSPLGTGEGVLVIAAVRDTTERRRMEEALRSSEARYRALFHDNPTMIVTLDADLAMRTVNPACASQLGYTIDELEGRSVLTLFHEGDRPAVAEQLRLCLQNPHRVYRWQFRKVRKDGSLVWVDELAQAGYDQEGTVNILVVCQDISERRRAEEALKKSEQKFAAIFHAVPALLGISTLTDGRFIDVNETCVQMLGYRREEMIGRTSLELGIWSNPADRERMQQSLAEQGMVRKLESNFRDKTGEEFVGLFSADLVDISGEQCMLAMLQDITERKRMEEEIERLNTDLAARAAELESVNRELEAFNYTVSHDLRKPLTTINSYCQVVEEQCGATLGDECRGYVREIYEGSLRMNELIDTLLNFSRMMRYELNRETVDLSGIAKAVVEELRKAETGRRVVFRIAEGVTAEGDAKLLQVVLENLLGNAWKYTGKRDEAVIEFGAAEIEGERACFVRDNGAGFDMAYAEKLFIPFQRLPGAQEFKGHGIGLATVERIIRRHGGRVWAKSEPGKGATFYFTLGSA